MNTLTIGQIITTPENKQYEITEKLGNGSFGITFKAEELSTEQICVIKQFKPENNSPINLEIGLKLFKREAEKLRKIKHNQIPKFIDYFNQESEYYLLQEYIEGHNLTKEITQNIKDEEYVTRLIKDILEVLSFLHKNNLIHRDLKPSNILRRTNDNKIVLIDFGAVKEIISQSQIQNNNQEPHTLISSDGYAPLEQKQGYPNFSSDIYAVGVIAIQALTGQPIHSHIFIHPTGNGLGNQSNETLDWHRYAPNISQPLSDIIDKMVMTNHRRRYQTAQEALEAIKSMLPSPPPYQPPRTPISPTNIVGDNKDLKLRIIVTSGIGTSIIIAILLIDPIRNIISNYFNPPPILNKKYTENNIEIAYSDQWDYKPQSFDAHLVEFIPKQSQSKDCTSKIFISRQELPTPLSVEEYKRKVQEQIKKNNKIEITDETKGNTLLTKKSAYKLSYTMKENQCEFQILETGTVHDSKGYYISYKGLKGEYEKYLPTLEAMINTFDIK
ncbi:protein kinase [Cylindrospermopsis raciborskii UAM/DH-BiRr]|uniref:protein kinase domain-containing protein n=1 Tax=Cylindrospermopsis raciborskii TaxID=77022 RepID=UPI0038797B96